MRLLLVEDDPLLASRLRQDLSSKGYAVDVAGNGIDAEHLGLEEPYDAVVLDLGLPLRSGLDVLKTWRTRGMTMPVLILTARDAWHEKVAGFDAGADDYLAKPFHVEELRAQLYGERNLDIAYRVEPSIRFHGDREGLFEMCGNLLDNACKWARSRVVVSARADDGLVVTVEDDGPGCSPENLAQIAQRGVRLDEATQGHGLGLAIVRGIASSYDAAIQFGHSAALGGFAVSIRFPRR